MPSFQLTVAVRALIASHFVRVATSDCCNASCVRRLSAVTPSLPNGEACAKVELAAGKVLATRASTSPLSVAMVLLTGSIHGSCQNGRSKAGRSIRGMIFRYANRTRPKYRRLGRPYCMLKRLCSASLAHFRLRSIACTAKFHPDNLSTTQFKISSIPHLVKDAMTAHRALRGGSEWSALLL